MMRKKLMMIGILLISILCISAVSAAEDVASDTHIADNDNEIISEENINGDVLSNENEELILNDDNQNSKSLETDIGDETLSDSVADGQEFILSGSNNYAGDDAVKASEDKKGTFTDLQNQLNNVEGRSLDLNYDFEYDPEYDADKFPEGIVFDKLVDYDVYYFTINGNGHTICGKGLSRIFYTLPLTALELKNVTLCHGFAEDGSTVLVGQNAVLKACNVTFIHNNATFNGGAVAGIGDVRVLDCIFINNSASSEEEQSTKQIHWR